MNEMYFFQVIEKPSFPSGASLRVFNVLRDSIPSEYQYLEGKFNTLQVDNSEGNKRTDPINQLLEEINYSESIIQERPISPIHTVVTIYVHTYY